MHRSKSFGSLVSLRASRGCTVKLRTPTTSFSTSLSQMLTSLLLRQFSDGRPMMPIRYVRLNCYLG
uniref:Uncharacterized protein n=1 Tax=Arundo donax TaxID=35708 RepID=A0A0A9AHU2_ARUDO